MLSFERWSMVPAREWLIVGKGPTAERVREIPQGVYNVLTLNDAIKLVPHATIAHLIDIEVFDRCQVDIAARAEFLLVPRKLHQECKKKVAFEAFLTLFPAARLLNDQGRVVVYDKWPHSITKPGRPHKAVACRYFSSEAALSILGELGVRKVKTIGVDGGSQYAPQFSYLTPLQNGRVSFDAQAGELCAIAQHYGMGVSKWT